MMVELMGAESLDCQSNALTITTTILNRTQSQTTTDRTVIVIQILKHIKTVLQEKHSSNPLYQCLHGTLGVVRLQTTKYSYYYAVCEVRVNVTLLLVHQNCQLLHKLIYWHFSDVAGLAGCLKLRVRANFLQASCYFQTPVQH